MTVNLALAFSSVGQDADESAPIAINTSDIFSFPLAENNDKIAQRFYRGCTFVRTLVSHLCLRSSTFPSRRP